MYWLTFAKRKVKCCNSSEYNFIKGKIVTSNPEPSLAILIFVQQLPTLYLLASIVFGADGRKDPIPHRQRSMLNSA